jgi:hypothetical protein
MSVIKDRSLKSGIKKQQKVELLKRVRKMLARPKGWAKGSWELSNPDRSYPAYCLATACQVAAVEMDLVQPGMQLKYHTDVANEISLLKLVKQRDSYSIPNFNDRDETKKKDVLALIDERIAQLEAK